MLRSKPLDNGGRHGSFPLALARETEVHSDRVHGVGKLWGGVEARSKILKGWEASGAFQLGGILGSWRVLGGCRAAHMAIHRARRMPAENLGHQNASKTCTLSKKVPRKRVPLSRKSTSKPFIIWDIKMRQKRVPLTRKSVENAEP